VSPTGGLQDRSGRNEGRERPRPCGCAPAPDRRQQRSENPASRGSPLGRPSLVSTLREGVPREVAPARESARGGTVRCDCRGTPRNRRSVICPEQAAPATGITLGTHSSFGTDNGVSPPPWQGDGQSQQLERPTFSVSRGSGSFSTNDSTTLHQGESGCKNPVCRRKPLPLADQRRS